MNLVNALASLLIVTSILVVETRRPTRVALIYGVQSLVLVSIFIALAVRTGADELYWWAASAFVTKVLLVPWILIRTLRKFDDPGLLPGTANPTLIIVVAAVALMISAAAILPIAVPGAAAFKPALMVSLTHFFVGVACIVTQRNILKQIFGYCLMENGSHLTLALLANQAPELVEIGVATDAIFAVIVMSFIATRIHRVVGSLDSHDLMTLKG